MAVLTLEEAKVVARDHHRLAHLIGVPFPDWKSNCHSISLALLRTGEFGDGRVARGTAVGVSSQHSWIVLGDDCYSPDAVIVDPTLQLNRGILPPRIITGRAEDLSNTPHGFGSIWDYGKPLSPMGDIIELTPAAQLSGEARVFLGMIGPLDLLGWSQLANSPVFGWPAAEIIAAIDDTPPLRALVPIDILGMLTNRNPGRLYR
jgi:hypothetical protein